MGPLRLSASRIMLPHLDSPANGRRSLNRASAPGMAGIGDGADEATHDRGKTVPGGGGAAGHRGIGRDLLRGARGQGYSRQKGYLDRYAGSEYSMAFLPKVEIIVTVAADRAEEVADRIVRAARTGRIGDGKIFVLSTGRPEPLEF